jgi:putative ABC transport system ATP-binding protein
MNTRWNADKTPEPALPRLRARRLRKIYPRGDEPFQALAGVDLDVAAGAFVAVMGQSGSGKTTLLNLLAGIDRPSSGNIWLDGERLDTLSEARLAMMRRRRIGLIFQAFNLLGNMSVLENVLLPALLVERSSGQARKRAGRVLEAVGLSAHLRKLPGELSGGQQQRVAIARALVNEPAVLLADEPTGNLDAHTGQEVLNLLKALHGRGQTIVLVTHDAQVASQAERIIVMRDGRVIDETWGHTTPRAAPGLLADVSQLEFD